MNEHGKPTKQLLRWFNYDHLPTGQPREISSKVSDLAKQIVEAIPDDSAELSAGLRKLLEAKDCFVRAAILGERAKMGVEE